jgi:FkbM family methyltransferase
MIDALRKGIFWRRVLGTVRIDWTHTDLFYRWDYQRVVTRHYLDAIPAIDRNHKPFGNYFLDADIPLSAQSKVYSLGILRNVSFDDAVSKAFGCEVFMYDPTPVCQEFMMAHAANPGFRYFPLGVWTEDTTLRLYSPAHGGSSSAVYQQGESHFDAECRTMCTLMADNGHSHIDVFKADIEGAALPILEQMVDESMFPGQVIVELERPRGGVEELVDFLYRVSTLRKRLRDVGYAEYKLPRDRFIFFSLELLFGRVTAKWQDVTA